MVLLLCSKSTPADDVTLIPNHPILLFIHLRYSFLHSTIHRDDHRHENECNSALKPSRLITLRTPSTFLHHKEEQKHTNCAFLQRDHERVSGARVRRVAYLLWRTADILSDVDETWFGHLDIDILHISAVKCDNKKKIWPERSCYGYTDMYCMWSRSTCQKIYKLI